MEIIRYNHKLQGNVHFMCPTSQLIFVMSSSLNNSSGRNWRSDTAKMQSSLEAHDLEPVQSISFPCWLNLPRRTPAFTAVSTTAHHSQRSWVTSIITVCHVHTLICFYLLKETAFKTTFYQTYSFLASLRTLPQFTGPAPPDAVYQEAVSREVISVISIFLFSFVP